MRFHVNREKRSVRHERRSHALVLCQACRNPLPARAMQCPSCRTPQVHELTFAVATFLALIALFVA